MSRLPRSWIRLGPLLTAKEMRALAKLCRAEHDRLWLKDRGLVGANDNRRAVYWHQLALRLDVAAELRSAKYGRKGGKKA